MDNIELLAEKREIRGKKVKRLRAEGWVPAVLYSSDLPSTPIKLEEIELYKVLQQAGGTSLIDLRLDGESEPYVVLAREVQRDVLTSRLQHVDFYRVRLDQTIKTSPRVEITGISPLVESGEAVLVQPLNQIEVECLPTELINSITVDVSGLEKMDDSITIGDLTVPAGVTLLADLDEVVVSVVPPRAAMALEEEAEAEEELELPEGVLPEEMEMVEEGAEGAVEEGFEEED